MKRNKFLKKSLISLGALVGVSSAWAIRKEKEEPLGGVCEPSPRETAGPFPSKTPAALVRANIISDRKGVALVVNITVQDKNHNCQPLAGTLVDVWHCDSEGYYSEYGGERWQRKDFTTHHFLRGRQTTDANGQASFISIYPGWYPGRAPHIHVEVLDKEEKSLLITQIAFPDEISDEVYKTNAYKGASDTTNTSDGLFANSLAGNMGVVNGNIEDGYTVAHTLIVNG